MEDEVKDQIIDDEEVIDEEVIETEEDLENAEASEPEIIQDDEEDDEEDRIVTIGDEPDDEPEDGEEEEESLTGKPAPKFVKTLRKVNRKQDAEIRRLKKQLEAKEKAAEKEKPVELGKEPTLAECNFDDKKYKQELISFYERKKRVEEQEAQKAKVVEDQNKAYKARQEKYTSSKKEHGFKDFGEAEDIVSDTLSEAQQGVIIQGAEDSALLVYALGKNPKKLEELSKTSNLVDFAFAVAKLETQLKVKSKKTPSPEKRVTGKSAGGISGSADKTLARLRSEAEKTGDYTKVTAYRRKHREG